MSLLCAFCSALDVRYVGYHGPNSPTHRTSDYEQAVVDSDDDDDDDDDDAVSGNDGDTVSVDDNAMNKHESGGLKSLGGDPAGIPEIAEWDPDEAGYDEMDPYTFVHTVPEMLATAETCRFCGELAGLFRRWVHETYPGRDLADLSLADSEVKIARGPLVASEPDTGARLETVRVTMLMRDPDRPELDNRYYWAGMTLTYQQVSWDGWPRLGDMLDRMAARDAEGQSALAVWSPRHVPYSARHRQGRVDLRLLRRWKEACFAWHGDRCRSPHAQTTKMTTTTSSGGPREPQMLRLVDVDDMCLVEVGDRSAVTWAVLSYVWGQRPFFALTSENRDDLLQPGSLAVDGLLPDTVADAIVATRGLGERYLWTDSLCILQDSPEDVARFVPAMEHIYGSAVVAIVDLGGENAFHGLPGISADRAAVPEPLILGETRIVRAPQPTATGYEDMDEQRSVYLQRGWTFQEALLSCRFVLFSADTVFWECPCATWREDANWEVEGEGEVEGKTERKAEGEAEAEAAGSFRNSFLAVQSAVQYDRLWRPTADDFDASYQALAHSYSRRRLSFEGDGLAAFSGILHALENTTELEAAGTQPPLEFVWGLPGPFLGVALTWPADREEISTLDDDGLPVTDTPPLFYRRTGKCLVVVPADTDNGNSTTAHVPFPSWSWVGWVGPVLYDELFGSLRSEHAGIRFYVFGDAATDQLVEVPQHTDFADKWPTSAEHVRAPPLWRETSPSGNNVVDASRAVPAAIRSDPALRQIVLVFWTSCCPRLHVQYEPRTLVDGAVVGTADLWEEGEESRFTGDWVQRPPRSWRAGVHVVEALVVGRDNLSNLSSASRLVVIVTERVGEGEDKDEGEGEDEGALKGMRRRVAALAVGEAEWNQLQTRHWEEVVLV